MSAEVDIKSRLGDADSIVELLPWRLGTTEAQRKRSRGRVAALAHQVAALLAGGWELAEVNAALADAPGAADAPDAGAQEGRWRAALKRAKSRAAPGRRRVVKRERGDSVAAAEPGST